MATTTTLISEVTGRVNGKDFRCFIRHGAANLAQSYCAAYFAVTGDVFSNDLHEYHATFDKGVLHFQFNEPKVKAVLEIRVFGRDAA